MKTCFKCGVEKPVEDFYRHPQMGDGRLGKCKDCTKQDMRVDRHTKPRVREYDRERAKLPHRIAQSVRITREWRAKHPDRQKAHNAAAHAKLEAPIACEGCGLKKRLEKHHHDYSKPLMVTICLATLERPTFYIDSFDLAKSADALADELTGLMVDGGKFPVSEEDEAVDPIQPPTSHPSIVFVGLNGHGQIIGGWSREVEALLNTKYVTAVTVKP